MVDSRFKAICNRPVNRIRADRGIMAEDQAIETPRDSMDGVLESGAERRVQDGEIIFNGEITRIQCLTR